jgi:superfamily II DNA or RNA helicase
MDEPSRGWSPETPGLKVRLRDNPGRAGVTTGRTKRAGSFLMAEVDFGPNEKQFKRYDLLELVEEDQELFDLLAQGRFGGPSDLRRVLTFEKIKGDLTNVFYSMEASNTDFYAHQFKPVMRFIESPVGRMLIADEVGLGKTIEATYIWKEIQARQSARRLLVVCPAMLRPKWRGDLRKRFNITGDIISAKDLLERLEETAAGRAAKSFVYITSLEGIRPPANFEDENLRGTRARLARLLDQNTVTEDFALFDHVIIDEAHYLRNPSTANNRVARLLREAARHFLLLTATPIQIGSDNLYQLLRLIDPDEFYDSFLFQDMLSANSHIVRAQRALWRQPADIEGAQAALADAEQSDYFKNDSVLARIKEHLPSASNDPERRVEVLRLLESRSLLSQYMTRSRKREVLEARVERAPQVLSVSFTSAETAIYHRVTESIRAQAIGMSGVSLFSLVARQRQMASSIVGALESWTDKGLLEELLWEDFGQQQANGDNGESDDPVNGGADPDPGFGFSYDIAELERGDAKYIALRDFLRAELAKDRREKFVVFAFFRGTLKYLARRLKADGISAALIMGDMGKEKDSLIEQFATADGPSVLLSSEVGSEGIDLQFCRFVVNYDLPWNPMKVEQRIGRLDRLGQKAERISIINLKVENTVEDRILMRLYDRINVFRESIGDLEEILGEITEQILVDLLNPNLTDAEREQHSAMTELAVQNTQKQQRELEDEAVNLVGFSDYILDNIKDSRDKGRWLSAAELRALVEDFFARRYPGTRIDPNVSIPDAARLTLSDDAQRDLGYYIANARPGTRTRLSQSSRPILCVFDPRRAPELTQDAEFIEPSHPLIQWIRSSYEADQSQLHRVSALNLAAAEAGVPAGDYVFTAHRWSFTGLKLDQLLAFRALRLGGKQPLGNAESEALVAHAARAGQALPNAANVLGDMEQICTAAVACEAALSDAFGERLTDFEAENAVRCDQQETSARKFAERRIRELSGRVARFKASGNLRPIAMTEGLIRKEEEELKAKIDRIARRKDVDPTMIPLAVGVIRVA